MTTPPRQPWLHDLSVALSAPTLVLSDSSGDIRPAGAQGVWHGDTRVLSKAELYVDGDRPTPVAHGSDRADQAAFVSFARSLNGATPDPTARIDRTRTVSDGIVEETIVLTTSATSAQRQTEIVLQIASDFASVDSVKAGTINGSGHPVAVRGGGHGVRWEYDGVIVSVEVPGMTTPSSGQPDPELRLTSDGVKIIWPIELHRPARYSVSWRLLSENQHAPVLAATQPIEWVRPLISSGDRRLPAFIGKSLDDLAALRVRMPDSQDTFLAAGAPWFFTLFGRDSIWAARLLLPLGTELAAGTLRALAGLQGRLVDAGTTEAPGKILHEIRSLRDTSGVAGLPPLYYGTVDATPLWICLLHDAWRWGMPDDQVEALLPHLQAALRWMSDFGDSDGDGFLEYIDTSGRGLANQGWKDSGDSIRFHSGAQARPPVALCEVQGYAYEAAVHGADLLDAFGQPGADRWRAWGDDLAKRFRDQFWASDEIGPYPALALDADKRPVDALTSNIGHLLGTGLLNEAEISIIVDRLTAPDMDSGFGLRTMSSRAAAFAPHSYHCGSVWPHDTAIVIRNMAAAGHADRTIGFVQGLLDAASHFDYRLPELYGGDDSSTVPRPIPYPAACRPQAWSAAASIAVLTALLGLEVDAPSESLRIAPIQPSPVGSLTVNGLRAGGHEFTIGLGEDGILRTPIDHPNWHPGS